jgi:hypothetical protein
MTAKRPVRTRRDRWADWAVIGVLIVALLLGWVVKVVAEGRRDTYTDTQHGLTLRYPRGWLLKADEDLAFQAVDPGSGDFKTTYQVRIWPIDGTAELTPTLTVVLNNNSLERAQEGLAYRLFDTVGGTEKDGQSTMEMTYVYVEPGSDLFMQQMPVVVQGLDIAVGHGDKAYVFSLLASEAEFEGAVAAFRRFVKSAEIW